MDIVKRVPRMRELSRDLHTRGERIAFVPTMGYLHDGHLSLVRRGREMVDRVVVSLFVNPIQFGPKEDLARYPRDIHRDTELCKSEGVDVLFVPEVKDFYAEHYATYVTVEGLQDRLCGRVRPGHFRGVATVVLKLLNIVDPHFLIMGAKDGQQTMVVRRMLRDLNLDAELVVAPTVREADGLAMSSRNAYLSAAERAAAPVVYQALSRAEELYVSGQRDAVALVAAARAVLEAEPLVAVEYVELVEPETLDPVAEPGVEAMLTVAIRLGTTRLIDNILLGRGPSSG